jgi:hypothetical protein
LEEYQLIPMMADTYVQTIYYWAELRTLCLKVRSEKHEILATGSSFVRELLMLCGKSGQETSYRY